MPDEDESLSQSDGEEAATVIETSKYFSCSEDMEEESAVGSSRSVSPSAKQSLVSLQFTDHFTLNQPTSDVRFCPYVPATKLADPAGEKTLVRRR